MVATFTECISFGLIEPAGAYGADIVCGEGQPLVFVHGWSGDASWWDHQVRKFHKDHRVVADFTWNTFRNHMIAEYEIPKYDGGLTSPNMFVPVSNDSARRNGCSLAYHNDSSA